MKSLKLFFILGTAVLLATGCANRGADSAGADVGQVEADQANPVEIMVLSRTTISRTLDNVATVLPYREVNLSPATPGRIEKMNVEVGDRVREGATLFTMDRSQLVQAQIQLASLEQDIARLDTLLLTGSARQQQYDQLMTQYEVLASNISFLEENTTLRAPFSGIITGRYFESQEIYSGAPTAASGGKAAVLTIMQINRLKITFNATEQYLMQIEKGMPVIITADALPGEEFTGRVSLVHPVVNAMTRTFMVEVEVPNSSERLRPGMFVRTSMELGEVDAFVVPANIVLVQEGTNTRYLFIEKDGVANRVEVETGQRYDDLIEVSSDLLQEGDRLISKGQARLNNEDKVKVVN